jgi:hypothetical protein
MNDDLAQFIKENPEHMRFYGIAFVQVQGDLLIVTAKTNRPADRRRIQYSIISCFRAADYSIRPVSPALIEGGPLMEFHEKHPLLESRRLQLIPGADGDVFDPPLNLKVLILGQTHIIAERFEITEYIPKPAN